jgi:hypothetical protein
MNTKIKISQTAVKGDWCNLKLHDGREVSVYLKSCPKLSVHLQAGNVPEGELECNLIEKDGKLYAWDVKEEKQGGGGGFKKETPEERTARLETEALKQRMIVAQSSVSSAVQFYQQRTADVSEVKKMAKEIYDFVMETSK